MNSPNKSDHAKALELQKQEEKRIAKLEKTALEYEDKMVNASLLLG